MSGARVLTSGVAGEAVGGDEVRLSINPSDLNDVVAEASIASAVLRTAWYVRACRPGTVQLSVGYW